MALPWNIQTHQSTVARIVAEVTPKRGLTTNSYWMKVSTSVSTVALTWTRHLDPPANGLVHISLRSAGSGTHIWSISVSLDQGHGGLQVSI